jgi:hypothetical protein
VFYSDEPKAKNTPIGRDQIRAVDLDINGLPAARGNGLIAKPWIYLAEIGKVKHSPKPDALGHYCLFAVRVLE